MWIDLFQVDIITNLDQFSRILSHYYVDRLDGQKVT